MRKMIPSCPYTGQEELAGLRDYCYILPNSTSFGEFQLSAVSLPSANPIQTSAAFWGPDYNKPDFNPSYAMNETYGKGEMNKLTWQYEPVKLLNLKRPTESPIIYDHRWVTNSNEYYYGSAPLRRIYDCLFDLSFRHAGFMMNILWGDGHVRVVGCEELDSLASWWGDPWPR